MTTRDVKFNDMNLVFEDEGSGDAAASACPPGRSPRRASGGIASRNDPRIAPAGLMPAPAPVSRGAHAPRGARAVPGAAGGRNMAEDRCSAEEKALVSGALCSARHQSSARKAARTGPSTAPGRGDQRRALRLPPAGPRHAAAAEHRPSAGQMYRDAAPRPVKLTLCVGPPNTARVATGLPAPAAGRPGDLSRYPLGVYAGSVTMSCEEVP